MHYSLLELNAMVSEAIQQSLPDSYWVEAEVSEVRQVNGHCYMQLIQKDKHSNTPVAQASARCWRSTWSLLKPYFERATGQTLSPGMKVLLEVAPQFHENYGFSWIVSDIDPAYTMGDMARKRQEILRQLREEGVDDLNKQLPLPLFAQRIAVISSDRAAGYGDFVSQLEHNDYGFCFAPTLFTAIMQGEQVERSVIAALDQINSRRDEFDCVVIIRGGGAVADLSGFDTLLLAENVANFPLPIITGIGHERDESVLDIIAHTRVKTPTAAAAFLINHLRQTADRIQSAQDNILAMVSHRMEVEQLRLSRLAQAIPALFSLVRTRQEARLDQLFSRMTARAGIKLQGEQERLSRWLVQISLFTQRRLMAENHRLQLLRQRAEALDPALLLQRGYSITTHNGHVVTDATTLSSSDVIETRLKSGKLTSVVV